MLHELTYFRSCDLNSLTFIGHSTIMWYVMGQFTCELRRSITTRRKIMSCNRLLKTGCNNIVGATLFLVVNNIEQYCWAWISPQSGVTMPSNIVDNIEQCCILFSTASDFWPCTGWYSASYSISEKQLLAAKKWKSKQGLWIKPIWSS